MPVISFNGTVSGGGSGYITLMTSLENVSLIKTGPAEIKIRSTHYMVWRDFFKNLGLNPVVNGNEVKVTVEDSYIILYRVGIE